MATNLNVRIVNKNDTYDALQSSNFIPLKGEIVLAEVLTTNTDVHGNRYEVPTYLMKVGDGASTFASLKWLHAPASDVYAWAKAKGLAVTVNGTGNAITAAKWESDTLVLTKGETFATKAQLDAAINALSAENGAIYNLDARVDALEAAIGDDGSTTAAIAAAQAAADEAQADATQAIADAKAAQDDVDALETTVSGLTATVESNKAATDKDISDEATARADADTLIRTDFAKADATTLASAKTYAEEQASTALASAKSYADTAETDAIAEAKAYANSTFETKTNVSSAVEQAVKDANAYADGLADNYDAAGSASAALTEAKSYADTVAGTAKSEAVSSAETYTNSAVKAVADRVTVTEDDIETLQTQVATLNSATTFAGTGTYAEMQALVGDDSIKAGAIYVVVDTTDEGKQYNNKEFVYNGTSWVELGDTTAELAEINSLKETVNALDTAYKAADASLQGAIDAIEADYLTASDKTELEGDISDVQLAAANDAQTKANKALLDANKYTDDKVADEATDRIAGDDAIKAIIGTVTEGKTVVGMIADAQEAASYDDSALTARVKANEDKLAVVQGSASTAGSIAKALADANAYTDGKISDEVTARNTAIDNKIAALSNAGGAIKVVDDKVTALTTRVGTAEGDIDTLQGQVATLTGAATVAGSVAEAKKAADAAQSDVDALETTVTSNMQKTVTFENGALMAGENTIILTCGSATTLID